MNGIICDVNVWFDIASGKIKGKEIEQLNLFATAVNLTEIANSPLVIKNPEFIKQVIQALTKHHYKIYLHNPLDYIMSIFDNSFKPDNSLNEKLLVDFSQFMEITDFSDVTESAVLYNRNLIDEKKSEKRFVSEFINRVLIKTQYEIRHKHIKKLHLKYDHINSWKEFIIIIIGAYSKENYKKDFNISIDDSRWKLLDFFLNVWSEYFKLLDVQVGRKFHDNDIHDLFNLVYVQPNMKYWTREKGSWVNCIINNESLNSKLFTLNS